jgi:hypothetical protein
MMAAGGALTTWCSGYRGDKMKMWLSGGESDQSWDDLVITVEGGSQTIWGGWLTVVMRIQCFGFDSREEATGRSITERWSGGGALSPWEGSVTRCSDVMTSVRGEVTPGREKGWDNVSWADANLIKPKNKEILHGWFNYNKWTVKI